MSTLGSDAEPVACSHDTPCRLRRHRRTLVAILGVVALGAAATLATPGTTKAGERARELRDALGDGSGSSASLGLGELQGRTHSVVIEPGPDGPTYAVYNGFGQLLASGLTADQLASFRPELDVQALDAGSFPAGEPLMLAEESLID